MTILPTLMRVRQVTTFTAATVALFLVICFVSGVCRGRSGFGFPFIWADRDWEFSLLVDPANPPTLSELRAARYLPGQWRPVSDESDFRCLWIGDDVTKISPIAATFDLGVSALFVLGFVSGWRLLRERRLSTRRASDRCESCGYDLQMLRAIRCPECGAAFARAAR
jgi:hypothetical protein